MCRELREEEQERGGGGFALLPRGASTGRRGRQAGLAGCSYLLQCVPQRRQSVSADAHVAGV